MRTTRRTWLGLAVFSACFCLGGGCPTDVTGSGATNTGDNNTGGSQSGKHGIELQSSLTVVKTDVPVHYAASVKAGHDLIVYGTGTLTGVSYVVPSVQPLAPKAIDGDFISSGFAIAGQKILLITPDLELAVFDSQTGALTTTFSANEIYLDSLPGNDDQARIGPVVADGQLAVTLNRKDEVADGIFLKLIDLSGTDPVVTALPNPGVNPAQVALDATAQTVVTYGDDSFFVYDLKAPTAEPRRVSLAGSDGILGPFAYSGDQVIYVARDALQNIRLLNLASGTAEPFSANPGNRDQSLAMANTRYGYFLNGGVDNYLAVYRSAIGVAGQDPLPGGVADEDPALNNPPWAGFGLDLAITPQGDWIFTSGNLSIDATSEFLQVSNGAEFKAFADGTGYLNATDVDASATLVAFKVGAGEDTKLAYIVLP